MKFWFGIGGALWILGTVILFTLILLGATATACLSKESGVQCRHSFLAFILWIALLICGLYSILLDGQRPSKK